MSIASTDDFSDLASVKSDSTFSGEALEELRSTIQKLATDMEHIKSREGNDSVEKLKVKNAELEATIQKLTEEIEKLKGGVKKDEEDILSSIIGSWQMVSSIGMKEYVQNRNENFQSGLWLTIFETGLPNFSYDEKDEKLTVFFAVGSQEFFNQTVKLGEKSVVNGMKEVTFVEDNSLVTVYFHENGKDEIWRVEKYLKDGQLRIVSKRFGLRCTRIYEKVGRERQMDQCEVEVLRKRIAELEAQVAGKDSQVQMDENQKVERLEQKNEELKAQIVDLVSKIEELDDLRKQTILDIARSSQAKHTDTPDTFSTKLLGRWEQINGGVEDCIKFIFINRELYMRNISHDVPFKRASNEDIQKALRQSNFDSQYSDRMAVSSDYTHGESRKCVYFFVGDNLVVCETGLEVLLKEKTPVKVYSKSSNYNYKVRAYKKTIVN